HVDQSINMKKPGFTNSDLYRFRIGIRYFLRRNPQFVQHDAPRPNIGAFIDALALNLLRNHVRRNLMVSVKSFVSGLSKLKTIGKKSRLRSSFCSRSRIVILPPVNRPSNSTPFLPIVSITSRILLLWRSK